MAQTVQHIFDERSRANMPLITHWAQPGIANLTVGSTRHEAGRRDSAVVGSQHRGMIVRVVKFGNNVAGRKGAEVLYGSRKPFPVLIANLCRNAP